MKEYIYVADMGLHVNIVKSSLYEDLLWKVKDSSTFARERGQLFYHTRGVFPSDVTTYYFTSPRAVAKIRGETYEPNRPGIQTYYTRRDDLLLQLQNQANPKGLHDFLCLPPHLRDIKNKQSPLKAYEFLAPIKRAGNDCFIDIEKYERDLCILTTADSVFVH